MKKTKQHAGAGAAAPKAPKAAAAKQGAVKPKATNKPGTKGKENGMQIHHPSYCEKRKRGLDSEAENQAQPTSKRTRNQPSRFGDFEQSVASPGSTSQDEVEAVGANEAREAEELNRAAQTLLGDCLEMDEGPGIMQQMAPVLQQLHEERAAAVKAKAEAKLKAQQAADKFVPVDQRKLPSPIKRCPELELLRMNLFHQGDMRKHVARTPSAAAQVLSEHKHPGDSDQGLQAAKDEALNLEAKLLLKEGEVNSLKQQQQALQHKNKELRHQNKFLEAENQRLAAALVAAQSKNEKVTNTKGDRVLSCTEVQQLHKQMEDMSEQLNTFSSQLSTMRERLKDLEAREQI